MSRKKYRKIAFALLVIALVQFFAFGCIMSKLMQLEWLKGISELILLVFIVTGSGMLVSSRSDKSYKQLVIGENDERNQFIIFKACSIALFVALICLAGVYIYLKSIGVIVGMLTVVFLAPVYVGTIAFAIAMLVFHRKM